MNKMMKTIRFLYVIILFTILSLGSCKKEVKPVAVDEKPQAPALTQKINGFIKTVMTDVYLWYDKMPDLDIKYEMDSKAYFKKLIYVDDKWSVITDDITALDNSLAGSEKTFGYALALGRFVDGTGAPTGNYFAIVQYVYPNSPAAKADFKRGDIIIKLNGGNITTDSFVTLFYGASATLTKGILANGSISAGTTVSLVAEEMKLDPVLMYKIIERDQHKIGYLMYVQFISGYDSTSLYKALQNFRDNQITDLVVDLRYNLGGALSSAQYLCSSIAPLNIVNNKSTLVTLQWNDKYQSYWTSKDRQDQLKITFNSNVPVKLGLSKVFFLTGSNTASASELTICGLDPYMDVVLIGSKTYGKYAGSFVIAPEDLYTNAAEYTDFKNWGLMPIVFRYANSQGITNFINGFAPDYSVDDALLPAYPLGELTEPLLKKAVENITGKTITDVKKGISIKYVVLDYGSSKFDQQKSNLFIELPGFFQKNRDSSSNSGH
jgi:carboxyl-terminal processing protease